MSRLAIGTVQFGLPYGVANQVGQVSRAEAKAMLQVALDNGIDTLDTAIAYGDSEACLGKVGTSGFKLITKLPALPDSSVDINTWVQQEVSASLLRMGVTKVYGLLLHRSEQLLGSRGVLLYKALESLKNDGLVQKIGISIYSPNELVLLTPQYHFDLVQAPFSLVDRRLYNTSWMQRLKDADVEIHTRSVFLQGLLLMSHADMPIKFAPWADLWQTWNRWLADHDCSAVEACLAFPLSFPEIDRVVVGADSVGHLKQIIDAESKKNVAKLPNLTSKDLNLIDPSRWKK
jgi:aryl-alcohol dehydrogenase-like predicted oxidoreductase